MAYIKSRKHAAAPGAALNLKTTSAAAALALALPVALAQTAEAPKPTAPQTETLPEVKVRAKTGSTVDYKADTVSSPKFTQPLVDTPQTITVIKKEVLQQQGTTSLSEALRNTPGITLQLGENGNTQTGDSIFMRGFDTSGSIFVDGIRDLGTITRDTFNIESVEVVKGPSGSDNGRGASSGYVNLVTKQATREAFNNASVSLGTSKRVRASADLNRPLDIGLPGSALRLNLMAQDYGTPGRDEVKNKRWGFAPSLAFGLGTPTRTTFDYLHVEQRNRPDGGVSTFGLPGYSLPANAPAGSRLGAPVDRSNYYGALSDHDNVTLDMFTARFEHDLRQGVTLRNTTRLARSRQDLVLTGVNGVDSRDASPDNWTVVRSRQGKRQSNEILTNQTNLRADFDTAGLKHSLSTGVEFIYERQRADTAQSLTSTTLPASLQQPVANLYRPSTGDVFLAPPYKGLYSDGNTLSAAVYAFDTLKLNDQWMLNGGLRVERFRTQTNGSTFTAQSATVPESLVQNAPLGLSDDLVSWKLGAVFKPTADSSVYVTTSNSYQPPGGSNFALSSQENSANRPELKSQKGANIEIGTKWDLLGGKLALTAAAYRSENDNELVNLGTSAAPNYVQIGKRRVDGIELGAVGQVTNAFNLSAGLAYMDPQILQGTPGNTGVIVFSPKLTFTSWATYKLPFGLTLGGGAAYVDTAVRTSNATTDNLVKRPSYWVANAMAEYELSKNVSLQFNINNLFDKDYISQVNNGGSRYLPGEKRNALLTANFKF
jgi:catecholate siderophore receptor